MQNQLASMFQSTAYYLCKEGVCDNPAEVFRAWTGEAADAVRPLMQHNTRCSKKSPALPLMQRSSAVSVLWSIPAGSFATDGSCDTISPNRLGFVGPLWYLNRRRCKPNTTVCAAGEDKL